MEPNKADATELQRLYGERFSGRTEYRGRVWEILVASFFQQFVPPSSVVLDLGAGYCEFINNVKASRRIALDLNPDTRVRAGAGVEVILHDCSTAWPVEAGSLDVVFTSNFLEHLYTKDVVAATLRQAFLALRPGGQLLCVGPNIRYVKGAYWDYFDHHTALSERSIAEVMELAGFRVEKSVDRFLPYSMSEGRERPLALLKLYLKLTPVWPIFGKQFFVIGRKPT